MRPHFGRIRALATKAENQKAMLLTEEGTKNAFGWPGAAPWKFCGMGILPMIHGLEARATVQDNPPIAAQMAVPGFRN